MGTKSEYCHHDEVNRDLHVEVARMSLWNHRIYPHATQPHSSAPGTISIDDNAIVLPWMTHSEVSAAGKDAPRQYPGLRRQKFLLLVIHGIWYWLHRHFWLKETPL